METMERKKPRPRRSFRRASGDRKPGFMTHERLPVPCHG